MRDYSDWFPVPPVIGWSTTNYNDRSKNGEVQQFQGFLGCTLDGELLPANNYGKNMIAVPEGGFHTGPDYFLPTPEEAMRSAVDHVKRLNDEAERVLASVRAIESL